MISRTNELRNDLSDTNDEYAFFENKLHPKQEVRLLVRILNVEPRFAF